MSSLFTPNSSVTSGSHRKIVTLSMNGASSEEEEKTETFAVEDLQQEPFSVQLLMNNRLPELPDYHILDELGRGGMGVVYRAMHKKLHRMVALKTILAGDFASQEERQRFCIEAEAVARLHHPGIVQIYEIGEFDGRPFLALEFIDGPSLSQQLHNKPQSTEWSAQIIEQVARAVHHAHSQGIIHRDLKPANILLTRSPDSSVTHLNVAKNESKPDEILQQEYILAKITDFGLAKQMHVDAGLTASGMAMGTPSYMAPENAMGKAKQIGPASDIYSLGAILFEMLTGRRLFDANTPMETLLEVIHKEPPSVRQLAPHVPRDLATICSRCLCKDPHKRYATAEALADDLHHFLHSEPIQARPINELERAWKWMKRNPAPTALLVVIALVALIGFPSMWLLWQDSEEQRKERNQAAQRAERAADRAERAADQAEWELYFSQIARAQIQFERNQIELSQELLQGCSPEKRGWEWHLIHAQTNNSLLSQENTFASHISQFAFAPDGQSFAPAGGSLYMTTIHQGARIWKFPSGEEVMNFPPRSYFVYSVHYTPDGSQLITGEGDYHTRVWDVRTGKLLKEWVDDPKSRWDGSSTSYAVLSPDGKLVVTVTYTGWLIGREFPSGKELYRVDTQKGLMYPCFHPNGKILVCNDTDNTVYLIRTSDGQEIKALPQAGKRPLFDPSGQRLMTINRRAMLWDTQTAQLLNMFGGDSGPEMVATFSPDGRYIATGGTDGVVRVWDSITNLNLRTYRGHVTRIGALGFHPSGRYLISGGEQTPNIKVWDLTRHQNHVNWAPLDLNNHSLAMEFDLDGEHLTIVDKSGNLYSMAIQTGLTQKQYYLPMNREWLTPSYRLAFSSDRSQIAVVGPSRKSLVLVDRQTGQKIHEWTDFPTKLYGVTWSEDGETIAVTGAIRSPDWTPENRVVFRDITALDVKTKKQIFHADTRIHSSGILHGGVAVSQNGHYLAYDSQIEDRCYITIWNLKTATKMAELAVERANTTASYMQFCSKTNLLAVGYRHMVELYDLTEHGFQKTQTFLGPSMRLAFSPDGSKLAGVDRDFVKVWDITHRIPVIDLRGSLPRSSDKGFNPMVCWSPDGNQLAISNEDASISIWDCRETTSTEAKERLFLEAQNRAPYWHILQAGVLSLVKQYREALFHIQQVYPLGNWFWKQAEQIFHQAWSVLPK